MKKLLKLTQMAKGAYKLYIIQHAIFTHTRYKKDFKIQSLVESVTAIL